MSALRKPAHDRGRGRRAVLSARAREQHALQRALTGPSTMTPAEIATLRMRGQRVAATELVRPEEVVAWLGAVQAQDYLGALWAVGLRLVDSREADVEQALSNGSLVRTWPMRGTLHFVAASDARWMLELLGPAVVARAAGRLRQLGLDDAR